MKFIYLIFSLLVLFNSSWALTPKEIADLKKQGLVVALGELTGAGSRLNLVQLEGIIYKDEVIFKDRISTITLSTTTNPKISDIVKIKVNNTAIFNKEMEGFVYK